MQKMNQCTSLLTKSADGLVSFLQTIFIFCGRPFVWLSGKINEKVKNGIIVGSVMVILFLVYLRKANLSLKLLDMLNLPGAINYIFFDAIACIIMAIMAIASIRGPLKKVSCHPAMVWLWALMCFFMIFSAIVVSLDWAAHSIIFTIVFPVIFFIWQNRGDYRTLFRLICRGIIIFNAIFMVLCFIMAPLNEEMTYYCGLFDNSNAFGQYLTAIFPVFLLQLGFSIKHKKIWGIVGSLVEIMICFAFLLLSTSRTAMVSMIGIFVVWVVLNLWFYRDRRNLKRMGAAVLSVIIVCVIAIPVTSGLFKVGSTVSSIAANLEGGNSTGESINNIFDRLNGKLDLTDKDADKISTHRLIIWEEYASRLGMLGHSRGQIEVEGYGRAGTTHNNILQVAYDNGILAGVVYIAFFLLSLWRSLVYYQKNRDRHRFAMFPLLLSTGFFLTSMLASVFTPFGYEISFLYWMIQTPLMGRNLEEGKQE